MANKINDWVLELGWDASKAEKGMQALEKKFKKMDLRYNVGAKSGKGGGGGAGSRSPSVASSKKAERDSKKKVGNGFGGRFASNLTPLNYDQRARQGQNIDSSITSASQGIQKLSGKGDEFSKTRVRLLTAEIIKLARAKKDLSKITYSNTKAYSVLKQEVAASTSRIKNLRTELKQTSSTAKGTSSSIQHVARSFKLMALSAVSGYAIVNMGRAIGGTATEMDALRSSMLAASGNSLQAGKDFGWVRSQAMRLGRDLQTSVGGFQQIGTAARAAGISSDQSKEIFLGAAEASTAFGLSSSDTAGVFRAFTQIMSKGNVQAEEIRGQLGDRLPGAFNIAATAMGMTTDEFNKQLKAGRVNSKEFMTKFVPALRAYASESGAVAAGMKTIRAEQNRMKTSFVDFSTQMLDAGLKGTMMNMYATGANLLELVAPIGTGIISIIEPMTTLGRISTETWSTLVDLMLSAIGLRDELTEKEKAAALKDGPSYFAEGGEFDKLGLNLGLLGQGVLEEIADQFKRSGRSNIIGSLTSGTDAMSSIYKEREKQIAYNITINANGLEAHEVAEKVMDAQNQAQQDAIDSVASEI